MPSTSHTLLRSADSPWKCHQEFPWGPLVKGPILSTRSEDTALETALITNAGGLQSDRVIRRL